MPDAEGRLSPAEIAHVQQWMTNFAKGIPVCPISNHQTWSVVDTVFQNIIYPATTQVIPPTAYPLVIVFCSGCGYAMNFSAAMLGLYPTPVTGGADAGSRQ